MTIVNRQYVHKLVDRFPESLLGDIAQLLRAVEQLVHPANGKKLPYHPLRMGGLWAGSVISDEDIESVRAGMWANFGESGDIGE